MVKQRFIVLIPLILGLIALPGVLQAQKDSTDIRELLENRDDEIKELMGPEGTEYTDEQREKLKNIINGIIDYSAMAEYALEQTYDTLEAGERSDFVDLFSSIVRDQSMNKLDIYRAEVQYEAIRVRGDSATVRTIVTLDRVRTPVYYKMVYRDTPGKWVVVDMIIDDVSTAESYRKQFQTIIRKRGYDFLVETLRKRADKAKSG